MGLGTEADVAIATGTPSNTTAAQPLNQDRAYRERSGCLLLIEPRALERECLASALHSRGLCMEIVQLGSIDQWTGRQGPSVAVGAVLLCVGSRKVSDDAVTQQISRIAAVLKTVPIVVLADTDELAQVLKALECGARGYIPTSVGIDVCLEAIALAAAGGIFVPASSVLAMRQYINTDTRETSPLSKIFTAKQAEIAMALRRGKANKVIAYELKMCESTVKVHIRNIMRRLNASNRTEVAYKIRDLLPPEHGSVEPTQYL